MRKLVALAAIAALMASSKSFAASQDLYVYIPFDNPTLRSSIRKSLTSQGYDFVFVNLPKSKQSTEWWLRSRTVPVKGKSEALLHYVEQDLKQKSILLTERKFLDAVVYPRIGYGKSPKDYAEDDQRFPSLTVDYIRHVLKQGNSRLLFIPSPETGYRVVVDSDLENAFRTAMNMPMDSTLLAQSYQVENIGAQSALTLRCDYKLGNPGVFFKYWFGAKPSLTESEINDLRLNSLGMSDRRSEFCPQELSGAWRLAGLRAEELDQQTASKASRDQQGKWLSDSEIETKFGPDLLPFLKFSRSLGSAMEQFNGLFPELKNFPGDASGTAQSENEASWKKLQRRQEDYRECNFYNWIAPQELRKTCFY